MARFYDQHRVALNIVSGFALAVASACFVYALA
jgi:hypothetical protein